MKRTTIKLLNVFLVCLLLVFFSCKKDEPSPNNSGSKPENEISVKGFENKTTEETVKMNSNVIYVKEDINSKFISNDIENKKIKFKKSTEQNMVKVGDVMFSDVTDNLEDGYALKIIEKKNVGENIEYSYEYATIDEVFETLDIHTKLAPQMTKESIKVYELLDYSGSASRVNSASNLGKLIGFDSKRFKKVKLEKNKASLTYIIWDADGKFVKTTNDQVSCTLEIEFDNSESDVVKRRGKFRAYGYPTFSIRAKLEYDFLDEKTDKKLKEHWVTKVKEEVLDKRLKLISFNLTPMSATSLAFKPTLDLYARFKISAEGKMILDFSYDDMKLYYNIQNYEDDNTDDKYEISLYEAGTPNVSFDLSAESRLEAGLGVGLFLKFPQFRYGNNQSSYIGIQNECVFEGKLKLKGGVSINEGVTCKEMTLETEVKDKAGIEAKLGIFGKKLFSLDLGDLLEYSIKDPWNIDVNVCRPTENENITPTDGLVAYYPFNGNANDESGNKNNGTVYGATLTTDRHGNANSAYSFDGKDDYINCNNNNIQLQTEVSVCGWFKYEKGGTINPRIIGYQNDFEASDGGFEVFTETTGQQRVLYTWLSSDKEKSLSYKMNNANLKEKVWYFFAFTYDGKNYKVFLDGKKIYSDKKDMTLNGKSHLFNIGRKTVSAYDLWKGKIDDIRIYNKALTESEVQALYKE